MESAQFKGAGGTPAIVAIGASAGGLDALERLFDHMVCDSGAAFVVIQHLSPDHKSMMANLLARHTRMPVEMVEQDRPVVPDHVYLIPPGAILRLQDGQLRLTPKNPRALNLPIDVFFQSMAQDRGAASVGVILSGTGSDGTRGALAVNDAGGLLIAQEPGSAKFDGMPRSVIATGLVDAVLPVEEIGRRILAHLQNDPPPRVEEAPPPGPRAQQRSAETALEGIMQLLTSNGGIDFQEYKPGTVMRRIERRMSVRKVATLADYYALVADDRNEVLTLRRELLIPVTSFFRDPEAFDVLARQVIEPLIMRKKSGDVIRVWAAGVATGEEPYSLAMHFLSAFDQLQRWVGLKIFATDVEQQNIEVGSAGMYPESVAAEVQPLQLERYFAKKGTGFVVKNDLRQCIVFARHNLLSDPPFTKMDLVVCRNTLIYFAADAQERVLKRLQYALNVEGHLFLGPSESLGPVQEDFAVVSARHKIWKLLRPLRTPLESSRSPNYGMSGARALSLGGPRPTPLKSSPVDLGFNTLLRAFAPPPSVLVNARNELVHAYGDVQRILQLRSGQASLELQRILPEPLVPVASALLFKASRENSSVTSDPLRISAADGSPMQIRLSAWPAGEFEGDRLALLCFEDMQAPEGPNTVNAVDLGAESAERIELLERELAATRESLQATIEELETSNEELQATNEELMSSNEELQSSNEELQSVNEELNTVNAEYQEKIDILNRLNADLDCMTQAVSVATVFVDDQLRLLRFSPDAREIFRLREIDVGRPLDDLAHALDYPDLIADLARTLRDGTRVEREVRSVSGRVYLMRLLSYRVSSTASRGAVASFMDVTALHEASRLQRVIDALAEHIALVNAKGEIVMVNRAWREFSVANGDPDQRLTGPGSNYLSACTPGIQSDDPSAKLAHDGLLSVLQGQQTRFSMEYPCHNRDEERWFVMHVRAIGGEQPGAVVSHVDVTQHHQRRTGGGA